MLGDAVIAVEEMHARHEEHIAGVFHAESDAALCDGLEFVDSGVFGGKLCRGYCQGFSGLSCWC